MKYLSNMHIYFTFSDETIERTFITTNFSHTQIYYNELDPADDSTKVSIPFDTYLANKLKTHKNEDIKVQIKNGADNYITGYVRKTATFSKKTRNAPIEIEIVNPSFLLDLEIRSDLILTSCRVDSVILALLNACSFTNIRNLNVPIVIPYFHLESGDSIKDALSELCKEYGYTFNFDNDGYFNLYPIFNKPSGEITQIFSGDAHNCHETLKFEVKEEEADSVSASWDKLQYYEDTLIFSDTSNGDATYIEGKPDSGNKCNIQVKPRSYLFDTEETYCDYDSSKGEIKFVISITPIFKHDDQIEVLKCINCGTKALLSAYNHSSAGQYRFTQLDINGNAFIQVAKNVTTSATGTKKSKDITLSYLYDKDLAEQYVMNLVNYYRYADFTVSLNSKEDFELGTFCKVSASGMGTITGRIIQKKSTMLEDMIQYKIEGISEYLPATVKTVTQVPSSESTKGDPGAKGEDGDTIVCPDLSQCVFYFSMDDVLNNKLINNADTTYATMNGCKQVSGLNGSGIKIDSTQNDYIQYTSLPLMESITFALFARAQSYGVITQQTDKSYYIEMQSDKLILNPDPSGQITINGSFYLDTWYLIIYAYANDIQKECVYVYRYGVENGQYVYKDKTVTTFNKARDFSTDWNDTYPQKETGIASGIIDELRLDEYAWPDNSVDAYAVLKGTTTKKYSLGDYNALHLDDKISSITPKYLGAYSSDPVIANTGDWYAYIGEQTESRKKGYCYYKLNSNLWVEDTNWDHIVGSLNDLLELTTDENTPATTFLNKLIANEAFIKKLATQIITLSSTGSIKSENYETNKSGFSITGDGQSEFVGMQAKDIVVTGDSTINKAIITDATITNAHITSDSTLEDITITGDSLFNGNINSGPLFLSSTQATGEYHTINAGTSAVSIWNSLVEWGYPSTVIQNDANFYSQAIRFNCIGTYGTRTDVLKINMTYNIGRSGGSLSNWSLNIYLADGSQIWAASYYSDNTGFGIPSNFTFAQASEGKTLKLTGLPTSAGASGTVYVSNNTLMISP